MDIVVDVLNLKSNEVQKRLKSLHDISLNENLLIADFIERIRIRCIKATKERNFTESENIEYLSYLNKIENYVQENPEKYEEAFDKIGDFYCENKKKLVRNRITDLKGLFDRVNNSNIVCIRPDKKIRYITKLKTVYTDIECGDYPSVKKRKTDGDKTRDYNVDEKPETRDYNVDKKPETRDYNVYEKLETIEIDHFDKKLIANWQKSKNLKNLILKNWKPKTEFISWEILISGFRIWKRLNYLDLSNSRITHLPDSVVQEISENLSVFILSNNDLEKLPPTFKNLKNLKVLNLSNNKRFCNIDLECLPQMLEQLYLKNTNFNTLPSVMNQFKNLEIFSVSNENLQTVSWKSFPPTLKELSIGGGKLMNPLENMQYLNNLILLKIQNVNNLHNDVWKMMPQSIEEIKFVSCNIKNLEIQDNFPYLSSLILRNNWICNIDWKNLGKNCPNLTLLNLENNQLTTFNLETLTKLKILNLTKNKLDSINCVNLPITLEELYLADNQIKKMDSIERLQKLKVLKLTNNEIILLPAGILQLHHLCFLFLANNYLIGFPKNFEDLKNLKFLDIRYNNFHSETHDLIPILFDRLPKNISTLKMSGNYLGELPCQLAKLPLDYLEAIDCNIRHICPQLRKYNLQAFENSTICESNLIKNDEIKILDLRENSELEYLNFVPQKIYDPPSSTEKFANDKSFEKANFAFITDHIFQNKQKFPIRAKVPIYNFNKKLLTMQEKRQFCHCCGRCGIDCSGAKNEMAVIETLMVMDFYLVNVETRLTKIQDESIAILELPIKPEERMRTYKLSSTWIRAQKNEKSIFDFELMKMLPQKWKALVRTILCEKCIETMKREISNLYPKERNTPAAIELLTNLSASSSGYIPFHLSNL